LGLFLARVVLPQMGSVEDHEWESLLAFLKELQSIGAFPTLALPYLLLHRPTEVSGVAATIGDDIGCSVEGRVCAAATAIRHWLHLCDRARTPPLPQEVLTALIERVAFRRNPGVGCCLDHVAFLITELHNAINSDQADFLSASLVPWQEATRLCVPSNGGSGEFRESERPALRASVARLAAALSTWNRRSVPARPEPLSITQWREVCGSDPLPEVRRAFSDW
jgi:hypothetical protein